MESSPPDQFFDIGLFHGGLYINGPSVGKKQYQWPSAVSRRVVGASSPSSPSSFVAMAWISVDGAVLLQSMHAEDEDALIEIFSPAKMEKLILIPSFNHLSNLNVISFAILVDVGLRTYKTI